MELLNRNEIDAFLMNYEQSTVAQLALDLLNANLIDEDQHGKIAYWEHHLPQTAAQLNAKKAEINADIPMPIRRIALAIMENEIASNNS